MKIGECCRIYGGPEPMRATSTKGVNLLGMLSLEILHLDIDSSSKTLVPMRPFKNVIYIEQSDMQKESSLLSKINLNFGVNIRKLNIVNNCFIPFSNIILAGKFIMLKI